MLTRPFSSGSCSGCRWELVWSENCTGPRMGEGLSGLLGVALCEIGGILLLSTGTVLASVLGQKKMQRSKYRYHMSFGTATGMYLCPAAAG